MTLKTLLMAVTMVPVKTPSRAFWVSLLRNFFSVRRVRKAEQKLRLFGVSQVSAVLFRCTFEELKSIAPENYKSNQFC